MFRSFYFDFAVMYSGTVAPSVFLSSAAGKAEFLFRFNYPYSLENNNDNKKKFTIYQKAVISTYKINNISLYRISSNKRCHLINAAL